MKALLALIPLVSATVAIMRDDEGQSSSSEEQSSQYHAKRNIDSAWYGSRPTPNRVVDVELLDGSVATNSKPRFNNSYYQEPVFWQDRAQQCPHAKCGYDVFPFLKNPRPASYCEERCWNNECLGRACPGCDRECAYIFPGCDSKCFSEACIVHGDCGGNCWDCGKFMQYRWEKNLFQLRDRYANFESPVAFDRGFKHCGSICKKPSAGCEVCFEKPKIGCSSCLERPTPECEMCVSRQLKRSHVSPQPAGRDYSGGLVVPGGQGSWTTYPGALSVAGGPASWNPYPGALSVSGGRDSYPKGAQVAGGRDSYPKGAQVAGGRDSYPKAAHVAGGRGSYPKGAHVAGGRGSYQKGAQAAPCALCSGDEDEKEQQIVVEILPPFPKCQPSLSPILNGFFEDVNGPFFGWYPSSPTGVSISNQPTFEGGNQPTSYHSVEFNLDNDGCTATLTQHQLMGLCPNQHYELSMFLAVDGVAAHAGCTLQVILAKQIFYRQTLPYPNVEGSLIKMKYKLHGPTPEAHERGDLEGFKPGDASDFTIRVECHNMTNTELARVWVDAITLSPIG